MIVDDEVDAQNVIKHYVQQTSCLSLVGISDHGFDALQKIKQTSVDLLFLDINLPQLNGLEIARLVPSTTKVVFTTALKEHALESYDLNAVDYLLKPISYVRFIQAINRCIPGEIEDELNKQTESENISNEYLFLRVDRKNVKVLLDDILCIEGLKDYVKVITRNLHLVTYLKLSYLEAKLPEGRFARIHKSYIVALNKIKSYNQHDVELENNMEISIGKTYQSKVIPQLDKLKI